jgi:hypothetical protein
MRVFSVFVMLGYAISFKIPTLLYPCFRSGLTGGGGFDEISFLNKRLTCEQGLNPRDFAHEHGSIGEKQGTHIHMI